MSGTALDLPQAFVLKDGRTALTRSLRPRDFALHERFVRGLSPRSSYFRLLSTRKPTEQEIRQWTNPVPPAEVALIATVEQDGAEVEVGVCRYVIEESAGTDLGPTAAVALVIADEWQRLGVGSRLMTLVTERARTAGVTRLGELVATDNLGMQYLAKGLGFSTKSVPRFPALLQLTLDL